MTGPKFTFTSEGGVVVVVCGCGWRYEVAAAVDIPGYNRDLVQHLRQAHQ